MAERLALLAALVVVAAAGVYVVRRWLATRAAERAGAALPADLPVEHPGAPTLVYFYGVGCPTCQLEA